MSSGGARVDQVFKYLDVNNSGFISKEDVPKAIRYLGIIKTNNDFNYLLKSLPDKLSYEEFEKLINEEKKTEITKEQIVSAFEIFDEGHTGKCSAKELFHALQVIGEKLNDNDIEMLKKKIEIDNEGKVDYMKIIDVLLIKTG